MKVLINEIPEQGMSIKGEFDPGMLKLQTKQIHFLTLLHVECFTTKTTEDLFVKCNLSAKIKEICSRCLEEFEMELAKKVELYYQLRGELAIELDDSIRNEIIIDYPIKMLCKQDCKGLCQRCGKNLNKGSCSCEVKNE